VCFLQEAGHRTLWFLVADFHELLTGPSMALPTPLAARAAAAAAAAAVAAAVATPTSGGRDDGGGGGGGFRAGGGRGSPIAPFPTLSPAGGAVALCDEETMLEEDVDTHADTTEAQVRPGRREELAG
jgi:hypothetical protein